MVDLVQIALAFTDGIGHPTFAPDDALNGIGPAAVRIELFDCSVYTCI